MTKHIHLVVFILISIIVWSGIIYLAGNKAISNEKAKSLELARKEAIIVFNKDLALRQWATNHGGVYVPITDKTPPNPHLSHIPNRDLDISPDLQLTLMNPAYMLRQVMTDYEEKYGTKGIITSKIQLNPINKPDPWSEKALDALASGVDEVFEVDETEEGSFLRLIRPMWTQKGCLKCHAIQGYQVGDLRGGVGVNVDMAPYLELQQGTINNIKGTLYFTWFIGLAGLIVFFFWGRSRIAVEESITLDLQKTNKELKESLGEIKTLRGILPICSYCKKIRDSEGDWVQLEAYIHEHSDAGFTHGSCPDCYKSEMNKIKEGKALFRS